MPKRVLARNAPPPEWLIQSLREAILWSDNEEPHAAMAEVVWNAFKAQGLHPNGLGHSRRYQHTPVVVIPIEVPTPEASPTEAPS